VRGRLYHLGEDWYEWRQQPALPGTVHVRVTSGEGGRLGLAELRIIGEPTSDLLRAIPVGRIEAAANAQLTVVDDAISPRSPRPRRRRRGPAGSALLPEDQGWEEPERPAAATASGPARGARPRGRPDEFYAEVADTYRQLAQSSRRPAGDMAARYEVPVTTVHRWVKEARRRGFLAPGRPGKAG
jgi:hypothetical protein